jgi:hypothetical protein
MDGSNLQLATFVVFLCERVSVVSRVRPSHHGGLAVRFLERFKLRFCSLDKSFSTLFLYCQFDSMIDAVSMRPVNWVVVNKSPWKGVMISPKWRCS